MERNSRQNFEVKASHFACSTIKRSAGVSALWKNGVRIAAFRSHGRALAIREAGEPKVSFSRGAVRWMIIRRILIARKSVVWGRNLTVRVAIWGGGHLYKKSNSIHNQSDYFLTIHICTN